MRFPQVRMFKEIVHLLIHGEKSDTGITPFQAFAATVGSRVGMGNIAGVVTAIFFGGPGAVFWIMDHRIHGPVLESGQNIICRTEPEFQSGRYNRQSGRLHFH